MRPVQQHGGDGLPAGLTDAYNLGADPAVRAEDVAYALGSLQLCQYDRPEAVPASGS
jgi:hypothetical protein